jgi:hypothetical protein
LFGCQWFKVAGESEMGTYAPVQATAQIDEMPEKKSICLTDIHITITSSV